MRQSAGVPMDYHHRRFMKKLSVLLVIVALMIGTIQASAEGGKVRGDKAQGDAHQHQVVPPWWTE